MEVSRQNPDMRDLESLISGIQQVRLPASSFWFHLCHLLGRPASFDYLFRWDLSFPGVRYNGVTKLVLMVMLKTSENLPYTTPNWFHSFTFAWLEWVWLMQIRLSSKYQRTCFFPACLFFSVKCARLARPSPTLLTGPPSLAWLAMREAAAASTCRWVRGFRVLNFFAQLKLSRWEDFSSILKAVTGALCMLWPTNLCHTLFEMSGSIDTLGLMDPHLRLW